MPRTVGVTHPLGIALAAMALLAADTSAALAQLPVAQAQEPRSPAKPSETDEQAARDREQEPPPARIADPGWLDKWLSIATKPQSGLESWLKDVAVTCTGCRGFETGAPGVDLTDANAPWVLQGKWRHQTPFGAVSTGFVGVRNSALPLSTITPIGGDVDLRALQSSNSSVFAPMTQWSLTASVEKTLVTRKSGATFGVIADVLMPVATESAVAKDARMGALRPTTFRAGFVFRW